MKFNINGKVVEVDNATITDALEKKAEEISITNAPFVIRTTDEDKMFQENLKKDGIQVGTEIGRKELLKKMNLFKEETGVHKSDETTIAALQEWNSEQLSKGLADAKIEPNKKVEEHTKDLETLKGTIKTVQQEKEQILNEHKGFKKSTIINSTLSSVIPDNIVLPKSDMMVLLGNKLKVDVDDNGNLFGIGIDGQPLKNPTTLEPLPIKDVVTSFFNDNPHYLKTAQGGAGGSDSGNNGGSANSYDRFVKEMADKGHGEGSEAFNKELTVRMANKTIEI